MELQSLLSRRRQLQEMVVMEENRLHMATPRVRPSVESAVQHLRKLLADLDREIADFIRRTPLWQEKAKDFAKCSWHWAGYRHETYRLFARIGLPGQ